MKLSIVALVAVVLGAGGCVSTGVHGEDSTDAQVCNCECPPPLPSPVGCLRTGVALGGDAIWLIEEIEAGADATDVAELLQEIRADVDAFDQCSREFTDVQ